MSGAAATGRGGETGKGPAPEPKRINLALQGGGSHGAFTWGVLDRFLDEEDVEIAAISGTSAGALNGAAFKAGMMYGGRDGARENLEWLWERMGALPEGSHTGWMQMFDPLQIARGLEYSPLYAMADVWARFVSPYVYGPLWRNPLRKVVEAFNYEHVCAAALPELFVSATRVRDGKIRVFKDADITTDAILASACLPNLFQAVEIENPATGESEAYWDGGYTGNPALFPLFGEGRPADIVVVSINPLERKDVPVTAQQIYNRINEISFNSSLLREIRAIAFVQELLDEGLMGAGRMNRIRIHMISDDELMAGLSVATKMTPNPFVLDRLKLAGWRAADSFLARHKDDLNRRGTVDLAALVN
ncbi:NTE family protein [Pontibaca methylaminivorans]|uniref:NTE family protein n=1 Tax=Pontibaca methylaminivorans TaxID=515897 RepID=A0A1R3W863_9RHOB|nr:NTE family protein [Pontibaca methylaminivorans]